jgi:hypothetical protein
MKSLTYRECDLHRLFHGMRGWSTGRGFSVTIESFETLKGVVMTTEGHIAALERRHKDLERQIDDERSHLAHDDMMIAALKRKKLEIKDELKKLQAAAA